MKKSVGVSVLEISKELKIQLKVSKNTIPLNFRCPSNK